MAAGFAYRAKFAVSHEECGRGAHLPLLGREPILRTADDQWRRQGGRGEASPYGWTSKNYVICVCFHCHGTSSYHTTNTLQGRRAEPR